jgi:diaminohydroxyphosphoribosylaminopyrimidine deaminase/5-amino-6-(5-phosphoribosylamino)uracil reductase
VLVEGGGALSGSLFDLGEIDEVHAFIAAKLIGGSEARPPLSGVGIAGMADARHLEAPSIELLDGDVHVFGRVKRPESSANPGGDKN